jgi:hypothetical protein
MALGHKDTNDVYVSLLKPTLDSLEVEPRRVDLIVHNDDIDDRIIREIEDADFVIADLTYARPSVYYEAGYAERAGTPVIYVCRKDHLTPKAGDARGNEKVHFDLQMKNIITWLSSSDQEFASNLAGRVTMVLAKVSGRRKRDPTTISIRDWEDSELFHAVIELEVQGKSALVRQCAASAPLVFSKLAQSLSMEGTEESPPGTKKNLLDPLDSLAAIGVGSSYHDDQDSLTEVKRSFYMIAKHVQRSSYQSPPAAINTVGKEALWYEILVRLYMLGSFLTYRGNWAGVRMIVRQELEWESLHKGAYWMRCIEIDAGQHGLMRDKHWLKQIADHIATRKWLSEYFMNDEDEILSAVCQFDFLQCLHTEAGEVGMAYPFCGAFYKRLTEPVVLKLLTDQRLRDTFKEVTDPELAKIIASLERIAVNALGMLGAWHDTWDDDRIRDFLAKNAPSDNRK